MNSHADQLACSDSDEVFHNDEIKDVAVSVSTIIPLWCADGMSVVNIFAHDIETYRSDLHRTSTQLLEACRLEILERARYWSNRHNDRLDPETSIYAEKPVQMTTYTKLCLIGRSIMMKVDARVIEDRFMNAAYLRDIVIRNQYLLSLGRYLSVVPDVRVWVYIAKCKGDWWNNARVKNELIRRIKCVLQIERINEFTLALDDVRVATRFVPVNDKDFQYVQYIAEILRVDEVTENPGFNDSGLGVRNYSELSQIESYMKAVLATGMKSYHLGELFKRRKSGMIIPAPLTMSSMSDCFDNSPLVSIENFQSLSVQYIFLPQVTEMNMTLLMYNLVGMKYVMPIVNLESFYSLGYSGRFSGWMSDRNAASLFVILDSRMDKT